MLKKAFLIFGLSLLLNGCGMTFVYNNLSMITPWYVDDFIELTSEQDALYQQHLKTIHAWHREHELPEYHRLLSELLAHLDNDEINPVFLGEHLLQLRQRWQVLIEYATPAFTAMAQSLSDEQVVQFKNALEEANQDNLKDQLTPEEHRKAVVKSISSWLGKLTPEQRERIESYVDLHPDHTELTVSAHRAFQAELIETLSTRASDSFPTQFAKLIADPLSSPQGQKLMATRLQAMADRNMLYQALWGMATKKQKKRVRRKLQDFLDDITALMPSKG